jgi:hypothetical protein
VGDFSGPTGQRLARPSRVWLRFAESPAKRNGLHLRGVAHFLCSNISNLHRLGVPSRIPGLATRTFGLPVSQRTEHRSLESANSASFPSPRASEPVYRKKSAVSFEKPLRSPVAWLFSLPRSGPTSSDMSPIAGYGAALQTRRARRSAASG